MARLDVKQLSQDEQAALRNWQALNANARGHQMEADILRGCEWYRRGGVADINKTPEPFHVMQKLECGKFIGRFSRHSKAQPDFAGVLRGGRSIMFEAKSTSGDRVRQNLLTDAQASRLRHHHKLGALTFVIVQLDGRFYTIPWPIWDNMPRFYGYKHIKAPDLHSFEVPLAFGTGQYSPDGVLFLRRADSMLDMLERGLWREENP